MSCSGAASLHPPSLGFHLLVGCLTLAIEDWLTDTPQDVVSREVPDGLASVLIGLGGNAVALAVEATENGKAVWMSWGMNEVRTISTGRKPAG